MKRLLAALLLVAAPAWGQVLVSSKPCKMTDGSCASGGSSLPALSGNTGKVLAVNGGETGVEWVAAPSSISGLTAGRVTLSTGATSVGDDSGLTYGAATDTLTIGSSSTGGVRVAPTSNYGGLLDRLYDGVALGSGAKVAWTAGNPTSAADTGLARSAAGVLKVTDGGAGAGILQANVGSDAGNASFFGSGYIAVRSTGYFGFSSGMNAAASIDTVLTRPSAAVVQLGAAASATPVAQTLQAQGGAGTNISGADFTVSAGKGTGLANTTAAGRRGDLKLRTQARGSTGTTADTVGTDRAVFAGQVVTLTESSATAVLDFAVASGTVAGGTLYYTIRADDGTDFQVVRGSIPFTAVNKAGTLTATVGTAAESVAVSSGTLTNTCTISTGTNSVTLKLNAVSSLTQTTLYAYVSALLDGTGVATTK